MSAGNPWLLLDACCALNLYATDRMEEILGVVPHPCAIAQKVEEESLFVLRGGQGPDASDKVPVDFAPLYASGVLTVLTLEAAELVDYVNFAAEMDDGEAMTCAIALHRGGAVATDDRKARRVLTRDAPHLRLLSTLDLVHDWAFQQQIASVALRTVLMNIRDRATYIPAHSHALRAWWDISI